MGLAYLIRCTHIKVEPHITAKLSFFRSNRKRENNRSYIRRTSQSLTPRTSIMPKSMEECHSKKKSTCFPGALGPPPCIRLSASTVIFCFQQFKSFIYCSYISKAVIVLYTHSLFRSCVTLTYHCINSKDLAFLGTLILWLLCVLIS